MKQMRYKSGTISSMTLRRLRRGPQASASGGDDELGIPPDELNLHRITTAEAIRDAEELRILGEDPDDIIVGEAEATFELGEFDGIEAAIAREHEGRSQEKKRGRAQAKKIRKNSYATKLLLDDHSDFSRTTSYHRIFARQLTEALEKRSKEEKESRRRRKRALLPSDSSTTVGRPPDQCRTFAQPPSDATLPPSLQVCWNNLCIQVRLIIMI
ncbi:hypothetical protein M5K25_001259 [Dendrobium thyrsiflorum]|uniref:Uncharacterized protein n=1 Tax=Dendrobium thyrsiflorum TaxID=117978 RepID=A0ABD0VWS7_DENTH